LDLRDAGSPPAIGSLVQALEAAHTTFRRIKAWTALRGTTGRDKDTSTALATTQVSMIGLWTRTRVSRRRRPVEESVIRATRPLSTVAG
jgi:hypothetical protein